MPRYIDADALIENIKRCANNEWNKGVAPRSWSDAYEAFIDDIEDASTVDNSMLDGYEQGYKDGLISATLKELAPMFEELSDNLTNSITDIITKTVGGASLQINTTCETSMPIMFETEEYDAHGEHYRITKPYCPNCNHIFYAAFGDKQDCINDYRVKRKVIPNYCPKCGQALDWSEIAGVSLID